MGEEIECLIVQMATENPRGVYDRIGSFEESRTSQSISWWATSSIAIPFLLPGSASK